MIDTSIYLEKFLQKYRFCIVKKYLIGDILDFGGNEGELRNLVSGKYFLVNYDHSELDKIKPDTIVSLAVLEHIRVDEVFDLFNKFKLILNKNGTIFITTPTKLAKPVLEFLAYIGLVDRENIKEHKHYWSKKEIYKLAEKTGFIIIKYKKFQLGFNQFIVFK